MFGPPSGCIAVTAKGKSCRNHSEIIDGVSSLTCASHRNVDTLTKNILNLRYIRHQRAEGVQYRVEEMIRRGILLPAAYVLTDSQARRLHSRGSIVAYAAFYLLMARYNRLNINYENFLEQFWKWSEYITYGPCVARWSDIAKIICVGNKFYEGVLRYPRELLEHMKEDIWYSFFDFCAGEQPQWFVEFAMRSKEERADALRATVRDGYATHPLTQVLESEKFENWVQERKAEFMRRCESRVSCVKGIVEAVAFHPARLVDWALSVEEKERVGAWGGEGQGETKPGLLEVLGEVGAAQG